jgi:hypothetical protein
VRFQLTSLDLAFKKQLVSVPFSGINYFWGQMGAGKTSIARLIDYCLGGSIELSPALQSEFVSATLTLNLKNGDLALERGRDTNLVIARWGSGDEAMQAAVPARDANGEIIPGTGVENLSDLIFWMSALTPPRVRTSKVRAESDTKRLSIRNLLWYCYLDQDEIDSSFFHLDSGNQFSRLSSLDVVRYVIGYHDEQILDLEAQLDALRVERLSTQASIESLSRVLRDVGVESELEIAGKVKQLRDVAETIGNTIAEQRRQTVGDRTTEHATDRLRRQAQSLSAELQTIDQAIRDLRDAKEQDSRHLHEIETLALKFRRSHSARAVLSGVAFHSCPRCTQVLPERPDNQCFVCGQPEEADIAESSDNTLVLKDIKSRTDELREIIARHDSSLLQLLRERERLNIERSRVERERNETSQRFDSAYLSSVLTNERERSALLQQADSLAAMIRFPQMLETLRNDVNEIVAKEAALRFRLKEAREAAEKDVTNINTLKELFLDCLVRSRVPGISPTDKVEMSTSSFLPELHSADLADSTVASFATLSSGGKKTLFKCCFAIAMHRLAVQVGAPLPELLIIDSPMKNISERENRDQFKGFYNLVYELKADELKDTQFILIDKEYTPPLRDLKIRVVSRHMKPNDPSDHRASEHPPLIPYYHGN